MQYTYVRGVYLREASDRPESALKWREKPDVYKRQVQNMMEQISIHVPFRWEEHQQYLETVNFEDVYKRQEEKRSSSMV